MCDKPPGAAPSMLSEKLALRVYINIRFSEIFISPIGKLGNTHIMSATFAPYFIFGLTVLNKKIKANTYE